MLEFLSNVYNLRILAALMMLAIATGLDIWKREINDALWIVFGVVAVVLIFFEPDLFHTLQIIGLSMIIAPLVLVMWRLGIFGGADAFGLIVLAALAPSISLSNNLITPFTTLTNAAIFSTSPLFVNAIRNLLALSRHENIFEGIDENRIKKTFAIFLGYRAESPKYSFSMEKMVGNSKKLDFSFHNADRDTFCNTKNTWVTPGMPYMLYIASGFVMQLLFGDIIFSVIGNLK